MSQATANKYEVGWVRPGGMGSPRYAGTATVYAWGEDDAAEKAQRQVMRDMVFSEYVRITDVRRVSW